MLFFCGACWTFPFSVEWKQKRDGTRLCLVLKVEKECVEVEFSAWVE